MGALVVPACTTPADDATTSTSPSITPSTSAPTTTGVAPTTTSTTETTVPSGEATDLVIHNARVVTMNPDREIVDALAVTDGDIAAVSGNDEVLARVGPDTRVVDVEGRTVIPGFVDPHTHLLQAPAPDLDGMRAGQEELLEGGTTTAGMPSVEPDELEAFRELDDSGEIVVRSHLYVLYNNVCGDYPFGGFYLDNPFTQDPQPKLVVAGVKVFGDGGVCRAPAVSFEYPDDVPQDLKDGGWVGNGDLYITSAELADVVEEVDDRGGQVVVHAIGDESLRTTLRGMADAGQAGLDLRHRIEHNSLAGCSLQTNWLSTVKRRSLRSFSSCREQTPARRDGPSCGRQSGRRGPSRRSRTGPPSPGRTRISRWPGTVTVPIFRGHHCSRSSRW